MHKLREVEEARRILNEGKGWSIWTWLFEKSRVRKAADAGTAALDALEKKVKSGWSDELKQAYREVERASKAHEHSKRSHTPAGNGNGNGDGAVDASLLATAQKVKEADDLATTARLDAEDMFAQAERRLSGSMAREAAEQALEAYDLREKAIRKAEAATRTTMVSQQGS